MHRRTRFFLTRQSQRLAWSWLRDMFSAEPAFTFFALYALMIITVAVVINICY